MNAAALAHPASDLVAFDEDGCPYNPETGEVLDPESAEVLAAYERRAGKDLTPRIETREQVEDALALRGKIEDRQDALVARRDTYLRNLDLQIAAEERRLKWWDFRFKAGVVEVSRTLFGRKKSVQFDHGSVAVRATQGEARITDDVAAIAFVRDWAPDKVKVVESVTKTAVREAIAIYRQECESDPDTGSFFRPGEPSESVKIDTRARKD